MKYIYLLLLAFCMAMSSSAQTYSFDHIILKNTVIRCEDIQFNAYSVIKELHTRKQYDSLYRFIDYWENKCGVLEQSFRLRQLLDIDQGRFNPDKIGAEWIEFLIEYRETSNRGLPPPQTQEDININQQLESLNSFLHNYARSIPVPAGSLDAMLLLDFYSRKYPTFTKIDDASPEESRLSEFYHHEQRRLETIATWEIALNLGYYKPFGKIERFGGHPVFGLGYIYNVKRHSFALQLDIHAGPSRDEYTVVYNGAQITHRTWTNIYAGLEYHYSFIKKEQFSLSISPGVGYDGISAIPSDNDYGEESKTLRSLNASLGLQGKYRYDEEHAVGLQLRINRADYVNTGGTRLNGGYVTLKVSWSFMDDVRTSNRRNLLR